jgi:protein-L-isoaspartate(D-aspartate) O-methyltransferase
VTPAERRRVFAEEVAAVAHLDSPRLVDAYASVPRERFLGPGPWQIPTLGADAQRRYRTTPDDDPRHIYHDILVAIDPARQLHNGQPSALARWIDALAVVPGDAVMHLGCGVGYYTAMLAELAGPSGRVDACDVDADLAARAAERLATDWPTVTVTTSDGQALPGRYDAMLINAGVTAPLPAWLAALNPGGRMVVPLTIRVPDIQGGVGAMICVTRGDPQWPARFVSQVMIYDCAIARDPAQEAELKAGFRPALAQQLRRVVVEPHERGAACAIHLDGFCLQGAG